MTNNSPPINEHRLGTFEDEELDDNEDVLADDDIRKIARLQLINASARFELLSANQQLIDFHLNRMMNTMLNKKAAREKQKNAEVVSSSVQEVSSDATTTKAEESTQSMAAKL